MREIVINLVLKGFNQKNHFLEGWSCFKFNNLGLARGMALKLYTSLVKGLKLKVRNFWGLIPAFVEVTGENRYGAFLALSFINRVKIPAGDFESYLKFLRNLENKICTLVETRYFYFSNYLKNDKEC